MPGAAIVIIGSGGHARVVLDICRVTGALVRGFLDHSFQLGQAINGFPVLGDDRLLQDDNFVRSHTFIIGLGQQNLRRSISGLLDEAGAKLACLVHPSCIVAEDVAVGDGTVLIAGAIINTGTRIGRHCILNTACSVDHDCSLEDGCQIGPGARLAGSVRCEQNVFIGTGAILLPGISVGKGAIVGAGATVVRDVPPHATVVGCPARQVAKADEQA